MPTIKKILCKTNDWPGTPADAGSYEVPLRLTDGVGAEALEQVNLEVLEHSAAFGSLRAPTLKRSPSPLAEETLDTTLTHVSPNDTSLA